MKLIGSLAKVPLRVLPWLMIFSGCDGPGTEVPSYTVRDSAGIRIVEGLELEASNETWRPSPAPIVRIGWDSPGPEFRNVYAGTFLSDGGFVVADVRANQLYRFSESGELSSLLGAPGQGPGEFTRLRDVLALGGDSVLVQDWGNLRVSLFAGDEFVADWRFQTRWTGADYEFLLSTDDGHIDLVPTSFRLQGDEEAGWRKFPLLRASADFASVDTIAELDLYEFKGPGNRNPISRFGYAVRTGARIAHAQMDQPEVRWLGLEGRPTQIVRWKAPVLEADEEVWASYERYYRELLRDQDPAAVEQRLGERRRDFGGTLPYFGMAHGDESGNVWLSTYSVSGLQASKYVVLTADGSAAHVVEFSEALRLLDLTADRVLAVAENDLGVQAVVVYRLEKPGA